MKATIHYCDFANNPGMMLLFTLANDASLKEAVRRAWQNGLYATSLEVEANSPEEAWALAQDLPGRRSASIGDVIAYDGRMYATASIGFVELTIPKKRYLFGYCAKDGSTPLGKTLELVIEIEDAGHWKENYRRAHSEFWRLAPPNQDMCSWGLESEILASRQVDRLRGHTV